MIAGTQSSHCGPTRRPNQIEYRSMTATSDSAPLPGAPAGGWHRRVWALAVPIVLSTLSTPLLGAVDTAVIGRRTRVPPDSLAEAGGAPGVPSGAPATNRQVWLAGGWRETPIYRRGQLPPGATLAGPAIIEQLDTTIVVEPGDRVTVDALGNLMIEVGTP